MRWNSGQSKSLNVSAIWRQRRDCDGSHRGSPEEPIQTIWL